MPSMIALLRGINVGGHNKISMDTLREICVSLNFSNPRTYIQSGNVVFTVRASKSKNLAALIENAIEKRCGFRPSVMVRSSDEMRSVVEHNPFAGRSGLDPAKLAVIFLYSEPAAEVQKKILEIRVGPEEVKCNGRELYIYFPDGMGRSKLPPVLDRVAKIPGTARNWNTVTKLLAMAEEL